jgi:cbb3-type cytochrome oxidase cytochrome c subunit
MKHTLWVAVAIAGALAACSKKPDGATHGAPASTTSVTVVAEPTANAKAPSEREVVNVADSAHGAALLKTYECNRCHDGAGMAAAEEQKHCVKCHANIVNGKFNATATVLAKWKPVVTPLTEVPSLVAVASRYTAEWVENYLVEPHDLRPRMVQQMPRLGMPRQDARDIAAYLTKGARDERGVGREAKVGDAAAGRTVLDTKGCGTCHSFTGVSPLAGSAIPIAVDAKAMARGQTLAPDLRYTRDRFTFANLVAWLRDPKKVKPDSAMPAILLTEKEAQDAAMYLTGAELAAAPTPVKFEKLPILERKVTYEEVDKKVLHKTCWHCHAEPDFSIGDGGPGNSGGFGFAGRGLNLASYEGVQAGLFAKGTKERGSVFAKGKDGQALILRSLLARHSEVAGTPQDDVRGMPLGMPPLSREDIQLVETWIAQGRPK